MILYNCYLHLVCFLQRSWWRSIWMRNSLQFGRQFMRTPLYNPTRTSNGGRTQQHLLRPKSLQSSFALCCCCSLGRGGRLVSTGFTLFVGAKGWNVVEGFQQAILSLTWSSANAVQFRGRLACYYAHILEQNNYHNHTHISAQNVTGQGTIPLRASKWRDGSWSAKTTAR